VPNCYYEIVYFIQIVIELVAAIKINDPYYKLKTPYSFNYSFSDIKQWVII